MNLDRRLVRPGRLIDAVAPAQAKVKAQRHASRQTDEALRRYWAAKRQQRGGTA